MEKMAMKIERTNSQNSDFQNLVCQLDADLAKRDGEEHAFYAQFNSIDELNFCVLIYENGVPLACGAFKPFDEKTVEIKRMYTSVESRGKGLASNLLMELEFWAAELGYKRSVLETGVRQPEAIALYKKNGYNRTPNYGQYNGVENSRCFDKEIPRK